MNPDSACRNIRLPSLDFPYEFFLKIRYLKRHEKGADAGKSKYKGFKTIKRVIRLLWRATDYSNKNPRKDYLYIILFFRGKINIFKEGIMQDYE